MTTALAGEVAEVHQFEESPIHWGAATAGQAGDVLYKMMEGVIDQWFQFSQIRQGLSATGHIDLNRVQSDLTLFAKSQGLNLGDTLKEASRHFESGEIGDDGQPLSESELDALIEDDLRTFDEHRLS